MRIQYRLPALTGTKTKSPYEQFYALGRKKLGMSKERFANMNVSDFIVSEKTGKILDGKELSWMYKYSDKKFMGRKYIDRAFKMYWLQWSPRVSKAMVDGKCEVVWRA